MSKTQTPAATLPADVAAYLVAATLEVMAEYGFVPSSEAEVISFQGKHSEAIGGLAVDRMASFVNGILRSRANTEAAARAIAAAVIKPERPLRCNESTLCPDDLIRPCTLAAGHDGYHDGGTR